MSSLIGPVPRPLILCDAVTRTTAGKLHVSGVFNSIRVAGFPHAGTRIAVFAQLSGSVGDMTIRIGVRHAARDEVVHNTGRIVVPYRDRASLVQLSVVLPRCEFPYSGLYVIDLFCHNSFVCDTTLLVTTGGGDDA